MPSQQLRFSLNYFENMAKIKKLNTIDLFAGIGGIRLAFERADFETVYANDFDKYCKVTYDLNFPEPYLDTTPIEEVNINMLPNFDVLLAGFPCQAFSIAGYRKGFVDKGRGELFFEITKILSKKRPKAFLLENVKNLKTHDKGKTYKIVKQALDDIGYYSTEKILNSMEYGNVPQNRERIYIVGFKSKKDLNNFCYPKPKKLTNNLGKVLDKHVTEKYYYNDRPLFNKLKNKVTKKNTVYQWRRVYVRENKNRVCPTLTANMGMGGHNVPIIKNSNGIRKITPRECARIQGFPNNFKLPVGLADSQLYKQMGNSVSTTVLYSIAKQIKKVLQ